MQALFLKTSAALLLMWISIFGSQSAQAADAPARPNIVWIFVDDMSANFSCYGEKLIETPHVDRLAREGTKFTQAFVTAPVCSPCRSALITGMLPDHDRRTSPSQRPRHARRSTSRRRGAGAGAVPAGGILHLHRRPAGRRNSQARQDRLQLRMGPVDVRRRRLGGRKPGQPFFMQVQLHGGKYRGGDAAPDDAWAKRVRRELGQPTDACGRETAAVLSRDPRAARRLGRAISTPCATPTRKWATSSRAWKKKASSTKPSSSS